MDSPTAKKKLTVIKLYPEGFPYKEISAKTGVSTGSITTIISELKGGVFPEVGVLGEEVDLLHEVAVELKHLGTTPAQSIVGLAVLKRIHENGLEPADMHRWAGILKMAGTEDKTQKFITIVYRIDDYLKKNNLTLDELDAKVDSLESKAAELQPAINEVVERKKEVIGLQKQRDELIPAVADLDKRFNLMNP